MVDLGRTMAQGWRGAIGQLVIALGVLATAYVSLGTSCGDEEVSISAQRSISFADSEMAHTIRIRMSPDKWTRLTVSSQPPLGLVVADLSGGATGGRTGLGGTAGSGGTAGAPGVGGTAVVAPQNVELDCGQYYPGGNEHATCAGERPVLVQRTGQAGAFTAVVTATLTVTRPSACGSGHDDVMELRIDVDQ